ncbi:DUF1801 domain-containing protein [Bacillus sp. sid0103]|uniref:iron chaperone n=1 Tax=Bacillus sp. sid0103 TaxID=2856337 RepID=UPI001C43C69C|nr:DUF1801 domain-containing protein [Bacillus sp. sid0103]MBV7508235.1 DUF1801 domain-containing protein [Bacillus sp. sid0103]
MEGNKITYQSIDHYIEQFPPEVQDKLNSLRKVIKDSAPDAEEKISYQMPAFAYKGNLVYFAAYKNHIGFYPTSSGIATFKHKLSEYKTSKGAVQFPIDKPLPYELISEIVKYRIAENRIKAENKLKKLK